VKLARQEGVEVDRQKEADAEMKTVGVLVLCWLQLGTSSAAARLVLSEAPRGMMCG
jgi:hypothetical protein